MANIVRINGKTVKDLAAAADIAVINAEIGDLSNLDTTDKSSLVAAINEAAQSGGGGTSDYNDLTNKPSINNVTLTGDKSLSDLGAASESDVAAKYTKPSGGIPASDLASAVQTSLDKADTALQTAPVTSVAGKTGVVTLDAGDVEYDDTDTYAAGSVGAGLAGLKSEIGDLTNLTTTAKSNLVAAINEAAQSGGGTSDYTNLSNKPSINGVTLSGDKTASDIRVLSAGFKQEIDFSFNCYINENGAEVSSTTSVSTDYILLDNIKALSFTGVMGANRVAHWYNSSKTYIDMSVFADNVFQNSINILDTKVNGAKYVRLTANKAQNHEAYAYYGDGYQALLLSEIVGDGVADDTDALQRYINCAGGAPLVADKTMLISSQIVIDPAYRKIVDGNGATIIVDGDFYAFLVKGNLTTSSNPNTILENVMKKEAATNISNFRITSSDGESGGGIEATKAFKLVISENYIYKCENGIRLYGTCRDTIITKNHIYGMIEDGLLFDANINLHQCNIVNNCIQYCLNCIHIYNPAAIANFQIDSNDIEVGTYPTADLTANRPILFEGGSNTIQLSEIEICGNTIQGHSNNYNIIKLVGTSTVPISNLNLSGNHISNSYYTAIFMENCSNLAINGNTIKDIGTWVYDMAGSCDNIVIVGDVIKGTTQYGGKMHAASTATLANIKCKLVVCTPYDDNSIETSSVTNVDIEDDVSASGVSF